MKKLTAAALAVAALLFVSGCGDDDPIFGPQELNESASLRVAHLSPDAPSVDVWANGSVVLQSVPFQAVSDYLALDAGTYNIKVTPAGLTEPVVIDAEVPLTGGDVVTVAATGLLGANDLQPLPLVDDLNTEPQSARVRFVHTSPDAPAVDVAVQGGPVLFANVAFREAAEYLPVTPGVYDLEVRVAGTDTVALEIPGVTLTGGTNFTVFAIGLLSDATLAALPVVDAD